jgi:ParB-like chromosome segregation protein Spo0J
MLEVRDLSIDQLTPAAYNPRKLLSEKSPAYAKLKRSLAEFGLVEPLVWNETTGHVVGGHARLRILRELGYATVPVSVVRLTAAREKALNVVLNNQEAQGRFDPAKLAELLTELQHLPEADLTGFGPEMLRNLTLEPLGELAPVEVKNVVEVVLSIPEERYAELEAPLNAIIQEHHLEAHVRKL